MKHILNKHFDVIIVGTGPGGATVARELTKNKKKVLMIEWGDSIPIKGSSLQLAKLFSIPGRGILFTPDMLAIVRGITVGGSSVFYYATATNPPLNMLNSHGICIAEEIDEIRQEIPIAPLSDELMGPMAKRIMDSAKALGYEWNKLPKFIHQDKCKPNCGKCTLGCPYGAKWNARLLVEEAVQNGSDLLTGAKVSKVLISNNKAVGVAFNHKGKEYKAYAPKVVVSAGGIGSPTILRASGIKEAGYDFFFDPVICVMGSVRDIRGGKEVPMAAGYQFLEDGYTMTDLALPPALYSLFTCQVMRFDRLFSHAQTLQIMVKAKDSLGGRLTDSGKVRKKLTGADRKKLLHGYERAKKILKHAGAKHIYKSWYIAAHPGGTVKINHLLDTNLETEYENLYVCDCSVIPEEWGFPPTFTLLCMAKRLSKHLLL